MHPRIPSTRPHGALRGSLALLLATLGCSGAGEAGSVDALEGTGPVYALLTVVFSPDDSSTTYIALTDSPDVDRISLEGAREFSGRRNIATAAGQLFVGSYDEPTLETYSFSDALEWRDEGSLSFANQGAAEARPESLVNERVAYAPVGEYDPLRIVWDPTALEITSLRETSAVDPTRGGLAARWGGYDFEERLGPPLRTVMYDDGYFFEIAPSTTLVVYDPTTHDEAATFDVPCPGMYLGAQDRAGNTYLSSVASPGLALYGLVQGSCVRRIGVDGVLDEDWAPDVTEWTGGRQIADFQYVGGDRAIGSVLHHEELEALGADFSGPYDADVYDESQLGNYYRPWLFDLSAQTATPIAGVDQGVSAYPFQIDGRTFLNVSYDEYTRAEIFEVDANGNATRKFGVPAYVESWLRVR